MTEDDLERHVARVIHALEGVNNGDALAALGVVAALLFSRWPKDTRGGAADSWFELIIGGLAPETLPQ